VQAAERARRSLNAQILRYIERGVAEDAPARAAPDLERELTERGFQPVPFRQERSGHSAPDG